VDHETRPIQPVSLDEIRRAAQRLAGIVGRSPLLHLETPTGGPELHVKLENLQPIGSFKLRGAANAIAKLNGAALAEGVYTASAGNMARGVAWVARRLGLPTATVVPDHAPRAKVDAVQRLGMRVISVTFERWWQVLVDGRYPGLEGRFLHPFADPDVIAGNGTIGLEILEQLPGVRSIIVPFGGGGLSTGIASAAKALKPDVKVFAAEVETAAPLAASLAAGHPVNVNYNASWVDGIGAASLLPDMWPAVSALLDGSIVVSLDEVAEAVRLLASRARVIAEGAGAASVAAGLTGRAGDGPMVAVVSGGNIDAATLAGLLTSGLVAD
jgi:threonine dehydratase